MNDRTTTTDPASNRGFGFAYVHLDAPNERGYRSVIAYRIDATRDQEHLDWDTGRGSDPHASAGLPESHRVRANDDGSLDLSISDTTIPNAPRLWYVSVAERAPEQRHLVSLVAFAAGPVRFGRVIDASTYSLLDVPNESQVGAIEWSRRDGCISQIYVAPEHRRTQVALTLLFAAGCFHQASGWPGAIHADGRRTEMGQRFAESVPYQVRVATHVELSPPMDPDVD